MPHVMLRRDRSGSFKRTVKSLDGSSSRRLEFQPGEVVEITSAEIPAILKDLGKALVPVEWSAEKRKYIAIDVSVEDLAASDEDEGPGESPEPPVTQPAAEEPVAASQEKSDGPQTGRRHRR